jgi:hypothetical protein
MLTENDLLFDLIKYCPTGSTWDISKDSWEKLSQLLQDFSTLNETDIRVTINDDNRNTILGLVVQYEFNEKIIHQSISDPSGDCLMNSWDHMDLTHISRAFPNSERLILKYGAMDYFGTIE